MSTVLITGAGARVGTYLAKGLAADGWHVVIHYNRSKDGAETLKKTIEEDGGRASIVQGNLNVPDDLNSLISRASQAAHAPLTALINNASTFIDDRAVDFTRGSYDHHMDVNLYAPLRLSQDFAAQVPTDDTGAIINMIDQRVLHPRPDFLTYYLSKSALFTATQTLAQALAPSVRVNAIGPGPTLQNTHQTPADFKAEEDSTPLLIGSPPEALLQGVRYLLAATSVTGHMIPIDGGQHLNWKDD